MEVEEAEASEILSYGDFELLRCDRCKMYLNCPPIVMYLGSDDSPYTACGRCFKAESDGDGVLNKATRNKSAETLAAVTPFPCKYYSVGCKERRVWPKIELHEHECMYRHFGSPLFNENASTPLSGIELIKIYSEKYPNLVLNDGVIKETFDKDFEQAFLIQQHTDLFVCKVRYQLSTEKAWFTAILLEDRNDTECNIEFVNPSSKQIITVKFKPNSNGESTLVDFKALKNLLGNNSDEIKCRVYLNAKFFTHASSDLLKEIQCPSCWDYLKGRIFMCSNGHNVCSECKRSLQDCPTCREAEIQTTRNFSLERVISEAFFPCKNHELGCSYVSTLDETICHYVNCKFNFSDSDNATTMLIHN